MSNTHSLGHPQANGQVEATNKTFLEILRKSLLVMKEKLVEEFPIVLCTYKKMDKNPTHKAPFSLEYMGVEF